MRISLSDFAIRKYVLGAADGHLELSALDNLSSVISRQGFRTVDLLSAFVKPGGSQIDRDTRQSPDFSIREELLIGRVKVLTETDRPEWHNKEASKHTSYFYNTFSLQLVGNYASWAFSHPVKD